MKIQSQEFQLQLKTVQACSALPAAEAEELRDLRRQKVELSGKLRELERGLAEVPLLTAQLASARRGLDDSTSEADRLRSTLRQRETKLEELTLQVSALQSKLRRLEDDPELRELRAVKEQHLSRISELERGLAEMPALQAQLAATKRAVEDTTVEVQRLRAQLRESAIELDAARKPAGLFQGRDDGVPQASRSSTVSPNQDYVLFADIQKRCHEQQEELSRLRSELATHKALITARQEPNQELSLQQLAKEIAQLRSQFAHGAGQKIFCQDPAALPSSFDERLAREDPWSGRQLTQTLDTATWALMRRWQSSRERHAASADGRASPTRSGSSRAGWQTARASSPSSVSQVTKRRPLTARGVTNAHTAWLRCFRAGENLIGTTA